MNTKTLYRPVGEKELILIAESGYSCFPPRLDWQPIFYPVMNEQYAAEIAEQWNTGDPAGNFLGFVTKFEVLQAEFVKYNIENVGGEGHNELWVPAEQLSEFNDAIRGKIEIIRVFVGEQFKTTESEVVAALIRKLNRK